MGIELAQESAFTAALYGALGRTLTYHPQDAAAVEIKMVPVSENQEFPAVYDSPGTDFVNAYRVQKASVIKPRRGDRVVDANADTFSVDSVETLNDQEWIITLQRCRNG